MLGAFLLISYLVASLVARMNEVLEEEDLYFADL